MIGIVTAHLWQSTLFAGAAALLTLAFRANKAHVRYCLWLSASYKFLIPFALLTSLGRHIPWTPSSIRGIAAATPSLSYTVDRFSQPLFPRNPLPVTATSAGAWIDLVIPGLWLCGVMYLALTRLRRWRAIRSVVRASVATNIAAPVEVRSSMGLLEPGVVGSLRPVVLLPHGIAERLTPSEMDAILAHELCHVRRHDNLLACVHMIVETIFWFHPLVWWIGARLLDERERACDEDVISRGSQPGIYAEAILNVCKFYAESPLACVAGVTGSDLRSRIEAIMRNRRVAGLSLGNKLVLGVSGMLACTVPIVIGVLNAAWAQEIPDWQTKAGGKMAFEVASVKLSAAKEMLPLNVPLDAGERYTPTGGLFRADVPLWSYIQFAYKLWWPAEDQRNEIARLPKWVTNDRYTIEARAAGNPTKDQYRLMVRSLLADRFQLAAHFETHDVPVLAVTLATAGRLGPKLIAHADGRACGDLSPFPVSASLFRGEKDAHPENFPSLCDSLVVIRWPNGATLAGYRNVTMDLLAGSLSGIVGLGRPLMDRTGLTGRFDFTLAWGKDPEPPQPDSSGAASDPIGPSALQALRDQLGFKLESARGPVQILVIDRVERPSEN
jgi:uncharacterized protein (TIGR03435 family)